MDTDKIKQIGFWTVEILLVLGAIVSGILGKVEIAKTCVVAAVFLYILQD